MDAVSESTIFIEFLLMQGMLYYIARIPHDGTSQFSIVKHFMLFIIISIIKPKMNILVSLQLD